MHSSATLTFGAKILRTLLQENPTGNVFVSPSSIATALAMTAAGARGNTQSEILDVIGYANFPVDRAMAEFSAMMNTAKSGTLGVKLALANAFWAKNGYQFDPAYAPLIAQLFAAEAHNGDFDQATVDEMNAFVDKHAGIKDFIKQLDPSTVGVLVNAIRFEGQWTEAFDPAETRESGFIMPDGNYRAHPMMNRTGNAWYTRNMDWSGGALSYGSNQRFRASFFMPRSASLADFVANLNEGDLGLWAATMDHDAELDISIPKFKVEYESNLNDALASLGMVDAFSSATADLTGMMPLPDKLFVSKVVHKAQSVFDEAGTVASAATRVETGLESAFSAGLTVNKPFVVTITDSDTGDLHFIGAVSDPQVVD